MTSELEAREVHLCRNDQQGLFVANISPRFGIGNYLPLTRLLDSWQGHVVLISGRSDRVYETREAMDEHSPVLGCVLLMVMDRGSSTVSHSIQSAGDVVPCVLHLTKGHNMIVLQHTKERPF